MKSQKHFVKNSSRFDARKFGLGLIVGCSLVVLTYYISLSQPTVNQQKVTAPVLLQINRSAEVFVTKKQPVEPIEEEKISYKQPEKKMEELVEKPTEKVEKIALNPKSETEPIKKKPEEPVIKLPSKPICDLTGSRSEVCEFEGDVRIVGKSNSIFLVDDHYVHSSENNEWEVRAYARKFLPQVPKVAVKLLHDLQGVPHCTVNHSKPAVVFSNGGFTGNYYHDYTDIIVPLFTTVRQFYGEVHFVVNNIQIWWLHKYGPMMDGLSHYEVIDYDRDEQVHCFPRVIVGMHFHNDLTINPQKPPYGLSMPDFTKFLRTVYALPRESAINLREQPEKKPRLLVIARFRTRRFANVEEIVKMSEDLNFEVVAEDLPFGSNISNVAKYINSFDVVIGVHGAGLTNLVFLPTNAVLIQIAPWGRLEDMCKYDFGYPSMDAKLNYLQYSICEEESTLLDEYPRDHAVFTDPMSIHKLGWDQMGKIYLVKQNVRLDVNRFRPVLQEALVRLGR